MKESQMRPLPEAKVYERGLQYWPYRASLKKVTADVATYAPKGGRVLDIMCGPGYLLSQVAQERPDLELVGVDIDERYVRYGHDKYGGISFVQGDVLTWQAEPFDIVVCTGALHHVPYAEQERAIANIASLVKSGFAIIADCYVDDYADEVSRRLSAARLGYEYLQETIRNGAPPYVLSWTVDILANDVLGHEFKTSVEKRGPILRRHFSDVTTLKLWPRSGPMIQVNCGSGYGDYVHFCSL